MPHSTGEESVDLHEGDPGKKNHEKVHHGSVISKDHPGPSTSTAKATGNWDKIRPIQAADPHEGGPKKENPEGDGHESDTPGEGQPDQAMITVKTTSNSDGRSYDKKQICFYCQRPQAKLPRHLQTKHFDESAVINWMAEKDLKLKNAKLTKLRNLGNHLKNCEVLEEGRGEIIVRYRPTVDVDPKDYVPCPTCYGYFAKKFLWKHSCPLEAVTSAEKKRGQRVRNGTMLLPSGHSDLDPLLSQLANDNISRVIKSDELILKLARKESAKLGHDAESHNYTRTKLREVGRLLVEVRVVIGDPNATLTSVIHPAKYTSVVAALKNVAGFDTSTHKYRVPSLALKIGHTIKKCATILKAEGLISGNDTVVCQAAKFLELCDLKWTEDIAIHAHRTLTDEKRNKAKRLPLAEDIIRLTTHLKETAQLQKKTLQQETGNIPTVWRTLNEVTLTQVMLFNRRRQGEISKMSVDDYKSRCCPEAEDHISDVLSDFEKELCQKFKRVEIVGKKGRTVPVLLTEEMEESMSVLLSKREAAGVMADNKFMFPCATGDSHIRAADCIRKYSVLCGAKNPDHLRSTSLRKQIATVSQVLNLKDNELDILAKFLGHDVRVHREFYRLPDSTLQVAKISKLLLSLEGNTTGKLAGKSLDEIEIEKDEDIPDVNLSSDSEDDSCSIQMGDEEESPNQSCTNSPAKEKGEAESPNQSGLVKEKPKNVRKYKRHPWTEEEIGIVMKAFRKEIALNQLPGKAAILQVIGAHGCLSRRKWTNIKDFIRNHLRKGLRK
ncbi:hypothetical protein HOLleu_43490 [Holothuria leucospilota]|nr:hypothetical protein HOLleu_43490 [Holothuria leucospilota]